MPKRPRELPYFYSSAESPAYFRRREARFLPHRPSSLARLFAQVCPDTRQKESHPRAIYLGHATCVSFFFPSLGRSFVRASSLGFHRRIPHVHVGRKTAAYEIMQIPSADHRNNLAPGLRFYLRGRYEPRLFSLPMYASIRTSYHTGLECPAMAYQLAAYVIERMR